MLIIGAGGGAVPAAFAAVCTGGVDGVELSLEVAQVAARLFGVGDVGEDGGGDVDNVAEGSNRFGRVNIIVADGLDVLLGRWSPLLVHC
jgi:hypothetical protein